MSSRIARLGALVVLLAATVMVGLLGASPAFATTGDSMENGYPLPLGSALATDLVPEHSELGTEGVYWVNVKINAGQTVNLDITPGADTSNLKAVFISRGDGSAPFMAFVGGHLNFVAAKTDTYTVEAQASTVGSFTIAAAVAPTKKFSFTNLSVPGKAKRGRAFALSVRLNPTYNGFHPAVAFLVERKVGRKWKSFGSAVKGTWGATKPTYEVFSGSGKIAKKGTFRIRARFLDAAHPKPTYSGYKTIVIK